MWKPMIGQDGLGDTHYAFGRTKIAACDGTIGLFDGVYPLDSEEEIDCPTCKDDFWRDLENEEH